MSLHRGRSPGTIVQFHERASLRAAELLAEQDPDFRERFAYQRRLHARKRRAQLRALNARPVAKAARERYRHSEKGKAARARAEAKRRARRQYGDVLGALF